MCKSFITKLVPFASFLFWSTSLINVAIFDPYRNARRIVVHTAECLHVFTTCVATYDPHSSPRVT